MSILLGAISGLLYGLAVMIAAKWEISLQRYMVAVMICITVGFAGKFF